MVAEANASAKPRTIMVHFENTPFQTRAMVSACGFPRQALDAIGEIGLVVGHAQALYKMGGRDDTVAMNELVDGFDAELWKVER